MRVKLFLSDHPRVKAGYAAVARLGIEGKEVQAMIRPVEKEADAEWVLRAVTPEQADKEFGLKRLAGDHVLLIRGTGQAAVPGETREADRILAAAGKPIHRRVFAAYRLGDPAMNLGADDAVTAALARDLPKIFRWQNLWRVASGAADGRAGETHGLKLEVARQPNELATGPGEIVRGTTIPNNTVLDFRARNDGKQNLWVVAVYLDSALEITVYPAQAVKAGEAATLSRGVIENKAGKYSVEGMLLFALPQSAHPTRPDFKFLEQTALQVPAKFSRSAESQAAPKTPFGELLSASVIGNGTRAPSEVVNTTPVVISRAWLVSP